MQPLPGHAVDHSWLALRPALLESWIASWLGERGSLTRRLRARCGRLDLIRLRQRLDRPLPDEVALLNLRRGERAWVREVLLLADGQPVLYAHSVMPASFLRSAWRLLSRLGSKPVGDAIFERPGTRRGAIRVRRLSSGDRLHRAVRQALAASGRGVTQLPAVWARRSPFVHAGQALWITEVFLPALGGLGASPRRADRPGR